jgi:hypothetical protein
MMRQGGAMEWSKQHKCHFALNKFSLMGFTRRRTKDSGEAGKSKPQKRPHIKLNDIDIKPKDTHKFLGVMIDQELRFKAHAAYTLRKGMKWIEHKRLAKGMKGIAAKYMKRFL